MNMKRWSNFMTGVAGGVLGALVASAGLSGRLWRGGVAEAAAHHHARTLSADNFVLVDRHGVKRATLSIVSGEPVLAFYGPDGKTARASIGVNPDGVARVRLYSLNGVPQAALGVTGDGKPGLALLDRGQHLRGTFDVSIGGEPTLRLYDDKRPRVGLDVTEAGSPGVALLDTAGKTRAALSLASDGNPALTMYDAGGNLLRELP
ncbi:MAG TPA: hypothetical protein VFB33_05585 [Candidatus Binataceae bacterium]|jgi:hypothetical protein|nr:hypothetical protein [Candidatus Binataceae bacterium]